MAIQDDIQNLYQQKLGRQADPTELASEVENAGKYGLGQLSTNLDQRASSNGGGGGQVQYSTPAQAWNNQPASPQGGNASQLYSLLMQRAQQGTNVNANDPNVRQQVDPAVAQLTRQSRGYINDIAEKSGPLANIQGEQRLASERTGQAAGQLESEVIARLQQQKAQEEQNALGLWAGQVSGDKSNDLARYLAQLQDTRAAAGQQLQSQSLSQSNDQFLRELALREANQNNLWDFNWAQLGI